MAVAFAASGCSLDYGKDGATPPDQVPQMVFQDLKQTGVRDNRLTYTVETSRAQVFSSQHKMQLDSFKFQEYDFEGALASSGEAGSATVDTASNDATITQGLKAHSVERGVTLETDRSGGMVWKDADRILKTDPGTTVTLTKDDGSQVQARGLSLDLGSNQLELEDGVQGTWTPETKQDAVATPSSPGTSVPVPDPSQPEGR